ncbi:protein SSUH2 homolog isoform X5 [Xiphias gladius]|uniref:protein SSUH2 homolog isoform X5 n=1 Tax=Xiphias gladius TaxID=8245 RepID=UPI001A992D30|nr:protein SSUH2 homolog isoform X5 [Xiphias gladius]
MLEKPHRRFLHLFVFPPLSRQQTMRARPEASTHTRTEEPGQEVQRCCLQNAFDPNIPEEGPSAPPPGWLDDIHGYQGHKGGQDDNPLYPPPPPYSPQPELNKNTLVPNVRVPTISEDEARDALLKFVQSKWTYSSKPARNLTFKELKPITVYRYRLETYTETRTSAWQFEPYNGQMVDGPQFGMCPPPWDIPVTLPQRYTSMVEKIRVPHTSFVKLCHTCNGCGKTRCTNCSGRGRKRCTFCHGHGRSRNKRCTYCHGRGRKRWEFESVRFLFCLNFLLRLAEALFKLSRQRTQKAFWESQEVIWEESLPILSRERS